MRRFLVVLWLVKLRHTYLTEIAEDLWGHLPHKIPLFVFDQSGQPTFGSRLNESFRNLELDDNGFVRMVLSPELPVIDTKLSH